MTWLLLAAGLGAAAGLAGAVALTYPGLVLLAVPAVARVLPQSALAAWPRLLAGLGPGGTAVAWLAACLLAASAGVVTAQAWRASRQRRMLRVEPGIGTHEHRDGFDLVTLPRAALVAYSLGGHRPQVVVSQGLRDRLDGDGLAAVLAHEAAHLRAGHDRWLHLARVTEAALWFADRKSTRLNSSHVSSSYAVFCLKKKNSTCDRTDVGGEGWIGVLMAR